MIIAIIGDPQTGQCNMNMEGITPQMARQILLQMVEEIDLKFNNGQPPPRPSGLIVPHTLPPAPAVPATPPPVAPTAL
jgi:hypothetical protein